MRSLEKKEGAELARERLREEREGRWKRAATLGIMDHSAGGRARNGQALEKDLL